LISCVHYPLCQTKRRKKKASFTEIVVVVDPQHMQCVLSQRQ
jgi:hypothetical protein